MDKDFERLIKVNVQGRVFVTCQSRSITDPTIIGYYVEIIEQAIFALMSDGSSPAEFHQFLDEQLIWLEGELDQTGQVPSTPQEAASSPEEHAEAEESQAESQPPKEQKKATGYVPEAKTMPERLKDGRSIMEHLLDNDCITLKLVTPNEAKKFKHNLLGKVPEKAEEELVASLRNVLHDQVRKFIRKNNGGPWASATLQHEVRMDITKTRTLRSLVTLARSLLEEREEWLKKTKNSLTGRFFGGRVKMNK
ncbi:MAG: hypothetical protein KZQ73_09460 [Candidatus Thiodiazotropha sp. (ex Semelilucina semeliformis)]|nr:hypothetical protein [Candidatus Thiodiazotropha sp. (ex Semelilucina semeliformis)]